MKKFLMGCIVGSIVAASVTAFAASSPISVITRLVNFLINGQNSATDVIEYQGHLYVPIRFVGENLGSKVDWNDATSTVSLTPQPKGTIPLAQGASDSNKTVLKMPVEEKNNVSVAVDKISTDGGSVVVQLKITNMSEFPIRLSDLFASRGEASSLHINLDSSKDLVNADLAKMIPSGLSAYGTITLPTLNEGTIDSTLNLGLKIEHLAGINPIDTIELVVPFNY